MILVTGGLGFIGSHAVRALLSATDERVVATRFRTARVPPFLADEAGKRLLIEPLDVASPHAVIETAMKHRVTSILHLVVTPLGQLSPAEDYRLNMAGLINVLEAGRIVGATRVSIASSSAVYGGLASGPFREEMTVRLNPGNPTEAFKKSFEALGSHYADRTGLPVAFLRIASVYGPLYHSMNNLPSRLVHAAVKGVAAPLPHPRGRPDFTEDATDFVYVKDCADGIARVHAAPTLAHRVYNIGSGVATSGADFAAATAAAVPGVKAALTPGRGPDHRPHAELDLGRTTQEVGYRPRFDVTAGMADYADWLRAGNPV
jgi:UDP-glucose 4-epimerase